MDYKRIALSAALALLLVGAIGYLAQSIEPGSSTPLGVTPDGIMKELPNAPKFIHLQVETREFHEFSIILYWGVATWTKEAGGQGRLAEG